MFFCKIYRWLFLLCLTANFIGGSRGALEVDFGPGQAGIFISQADCKGDEFKVEEYTNYPNITRPHGSNNNFLKITGSGCMMTIPLHLEESSQITMTYMSVSPGVRLQIIIGDNMYEPNTNVSSWNSFTKNITNVFENAQLKFLAESTGGKPLLIIDSFKITPGPSPRESTAASTQPTTESREKFKQTIPTKTTSKAVSNKSTASETTNLTTLVSEDTNRAKKERRQDSPQEESEEYVNDPYVYVVKPKKNYRAPEQTAAKSGPAHPKTDVLFWTVLAVISLLIILLLYVALISLTRTLIRANCV